MNIDDFLLYTAQKLKGVVQIEKVWTNPSPANEFTPQDINISNLTEYSFIAIRTYPQGAIQILALDSNVMMLGAAYPTGGIWLYARKVSASSQSNTVQFENGYHEDYTGKTSIDNNAMKPHTIYGIKVIGGGYRIKRIFSRFRKAVRI